jgi:hypothetical protein
MTAWHTVETCAICGGPTVVEHADGRREFVRAGGGVVNASRTSVGTVHRECYEKTYGLWGAEVSDLGLGRKEEYL